MNKAVHYPITAWLLKIIAPSSCQEQAAHSVFLFSLWPRNASPLNKLLLLTDLLAMLLSAEVPCKLDLQPPYNYKGYPHALPTAEICSAGNSLYKWSICAGMPLDAIPLTACLSDRIYMKHQKWPEVTFGILLKSIHSMSRVSCQRQHVHYHL